MSVAASSKAMRRAARDAEVSAMRDGRKVRAATFRARKGKGSYRRKAKHGKGRFDA